MCGIVGLFHRDRRPVDARLLSAMTATLAHRGPDDHDVWCEGHVGLGHRRLAIRDLSAAGRQPLADPTGRVIVSYNGEIYNDAALREELSAKHGARFRSTCDTEILPAGYLAWGEGLFERLEGMFAVILWDRETGRLLLARDGVGIKPLFYFADGSVVRAASEIKALLADDAQPARLSPANIHRFLAMGYAGPTSTTVDGVRQVAPGTVLTFTATGREERRFWQPRRAPTIFSRAEAVREFLPIWERVVADQLVSDVPVGILQSGGIDSTLVSLEANRRRKLSLFTASFGEDSFDELPAARRVAALLGSELHAIRVEDGNSFGDVLPTVVHHYDGQVCDEASVSLLMLSREVRRHVTVALCGDGGDEFFAGYQTYQASRMATVLGRIVPGSLLRGAGKWGYRLSAGNETRLPASEVLFRFALGTAAGAAQAHVRWRRLLPDFLMEDVYGPELRPFIGDDPFAEYQAYFEEAEAGSLVDRCLLADQRFLLPSGLLLKTDAMSMAASLEVRVPFLDRRIMEFAGRCHHAILMDWKGQGKQVLRTAARTLGAPDEIVMARKHGFNAPLARLLRGPVKPLAEEIFARNPPCLEPFLRPDAVRGLWREHAEGRANHAYALWPILNLGLWRSQGLGRAPGAQPRETAASLASQ